MTKEETLYKLYEEAFNICMSNIDSVPESKDGGPANPLLIQPSKEYFKSDYKVMYVGQETNGYEGPYRDSKGVSHLLNVYDLFANKGGCFKRGGQFWNAVKAFQMKFSENNSNTEFVWNNIVKIGKDWSKGIPPRTVLDWQAPWFDLFRKELEILNPDRVIFFTGPNYDNMIKKAFTDATFIEVEGFKPRELALVKSKDLPNRTYRTYHPGFLYRFGFNRVLNVIC
jgi:hypothetical protein